MNIVFGNLEFTVDDGLIRMVRCGSFQSKAGAPFTAVQVLGRNQYSDLGAKQIILSETKESKYLSHTQTEQELVIVQASPVVEQKTVIRAFDDTNTLSIYTEYKNITDEEIVLEAATAFIVGGIGEDTNEASRELYYTRFHQSQHSECQPTRNSFKTLGLFNGTGKDIQKKIAFANIGSWSTKEEIPQGIIESTRTGDVMMFQIESNASWYYEISEYKKQYYLCLSGPTVAAGDWSKNLIPGESYTTRTVALSFGKSLDNAVGEMTKYRRHIAAKGAVDTEMPTIFNEYMHLSWDSPSAETSEIYAPVVAKTGMKYYVIDCGWHNEEPGNKIYPYVGQWKESRARFPKGIRKTTDFIRSLGMKAGLWIEPEIVGCQCEDMLAYYDDDCFMQRNGKRVCVLGRYFLDYRNPKVVEYMTETIRRMVEDYGAEYIKCDYNQDVGTGTDYNTFCAGLGLEECSQAFFEWIKSMTEKFPNVVFEGCASGGMRMDYKSLSAFSLMSTSDQIDYLQYPCIAGNILSAVLPEQAAVWSYPVGKCKKEEITDRQIITNMVNSFLGRMHLASHLEYMDDHKLELVRQGVEYYDTLTEMKKAALPRFPLGLTDLSEKKIASGLKNGKNLYLGVWCVGDDSRIEIPLPEGIEAVKMGYPYRPNAKFTYTEDTLTVDFDEAGSAAFFEIKCKN